MCNMCTLQTLLTVKQIERKSNSVYRSVDILKKNQYHAKILSRLKVLSGKMV